MPRKTEAVKRNKLKNFPKQRSVKIIKMKQKNKGVVKRCLSIILTLVMLVTETGFASFTKEVNASAYADTITLYFIDNTAENWVKNNGAIIQLVDNTNGHNCYDMVKIDNKTWSVTVPQSAENITFNRFDSGKSTQWNSWSAGGRNSYNAYYADGAEYGHWDVAEPENEENYFHAGDIVYLDLTGFTAWENNGALMYVNFTDASKENNGGKDINISTGDSLLYNPVLTDYVEENHVYAYIVAKSDEGKDVLRFWRGSTDDIWNASVVLNYNEYKKGNNCINVTGWDLSGYVSKKDYKINLEADKDNDGVSDYLEAVLGLDKSNPDTDGDGISDYNEIVMTKTNPLIYDSVQEGIPDSEADLDNDGINNKDEIILGTNPNKADTDDDGLTDYEEIHTYNTNPVLADTDDDKLNDGDEIVLGFNPLLRDTDGNGIIDGEEYILQNVNGERFDEDIYNDNAAVPVDLTVLAQGNVNSNINITEYAECLKGDERSYVGKAIQITGSEINSGSISFAMDDSYQIKNYELAGENTNGLVICYNDGENTIPLETAYDEVTRKLTSDMSGQGIYFVMDVMDWINSLGIDYEKINTDLVSENVKDSRKMQKSTVKTSNVRVKGQADIVFIVDTTGSMGSYITNVKNNINAFVDEITEARITPYFSLVEYKDITCDGSGSTNTKKNTDNSNWFRNADDFKSELAKLGASGGGDEPETLIDALEMARRLDLRKTSQKFFIVVTDAGYKVSNSYGIQSMDEMIGLLNDDEINVSVVSTERNKSKYQSLYDMTGGIFAGVEGNFKNELLSIADLINEETNSGYWIALEGLLPQYVKLKEEPVKNGTCDSDGDSLYDWNELDNLNSVRIIKVSPYIAALKLKADITKVQDISIKVYGFTSSPVKTDTDDDGLLDGKPVYVDYINSKGVTERLEAAPKDPEPRNYTGGKNLWKTHIESMKNGGKLATEDSDDYYKPTKPYIDVEWDGWLPDIDTNLIEILNSLYAGAESVLGDFRYDAEHTALHTYGFQWQVIGGYNDIYDFVFDVVCSMDRRKFVFEYGDKDYAIWAWKGSYLNLGPGSEVGFYEKENNVGLWSFGDFLKMSCSLYHVSGGGSYRTLYNWYPQERQWWSTGFVPDEVLIKQEELIQVSSVELPTEAMYNKFKRDYKNTERAKEMIFDDEEMKVWLVW
ncbi:MAG: VWA domain-containing protein [Lachnospiraceae bacterium]|nr:VWA domain-containing protein [Lachnospiraceae bacterium]